MVEYLHDRTSRQNHVAVPTVPSPVQRCPEGQLEAGEQACELLRLVELPLAMPSIAAGIRVAAVVGVGSATIAAAIGAGGLGEYIYRGLSMVDSTVILAGAVPAALLALAVDGGLLWVERQLSTRRRSASRRAVRVAAVATLAVMLVSIVTAAGRSNAAVVVGSKNFTEQLILSELLAQTVERAGLPVDRRLNLGGTLICDRALLTGDIDMYVEYTGTALTATPAAFTNRTSADPNVVGSIGLLNVSVTCVGVTVWLATNVRASARLLGEAWIR